MVCVCLKAAPLPKKGADPFLSIVMLGLPATPCSTAPISASGAQKSESESTLTLRRLYQPQSRLRATQPRVPSDCRTRTQPARLPSVLSMSP